MPRPPPDYRGRAVLDAARSSDDYAGDHAYELSLFFLIKSNDCTLPEVREAFELYASPTHRHVLDAAILGKATDELLGSSLDMSLTTAPAYRHLFFDRGVFPHAFAVYDYVQGLTVPPTTKQWYEMALQQGPEVLLNRYRIGKRPRLDPREVIQALLADQYDRALLHRGHQINSEVAHAALAWGKEAIRTATILISKDQGDPSSAGESLKLALKTTDETLSAEAAGINPEELVTE